MGIGRREFFKFTSIALAGLAIDPLNVVAVNNNVYINKKLGILFNKPQDWGFVAIKDFGKIKDGQLFGEGLELSKDEIIDELGYPICIATKYFEELPENKGLFSPTISLYVTPKEELEDLGCETFEELMEMSLVGVSNLLKDFRVKKEYKPFQICKCNFYEYDAEYMFEHIELDEPLKVELKVIKAEHNGFYYYFNCHQSKTQNQHAEKEFEEFKLSIKLI